MSNFYFPGTILVLFCVLKRSMQLLEGETCVVNKDIVGTCKNLTDCLYAYNLIRTMKKRPTHCSWHYDSNEEVVCCPLDSQLFQTGELRDAFGGSDDGILRSDKMKCRYDGSLPFVCCADSKNDDALPEPDGCPKLPEPEKNLTHVAWTKCVEYQRYANVCEQSESNNKVYVRRDACAMNVLANKISGGVPAAEREFPHMALLGCFQGLENGARIRWVAGGTLISERFILTAAHVVASKDCDAVRYALLGVLSKLKAQDGVLYNVIRIERHKYYRASEKSYDIALMELDRRVIFSDFIRPACLPLPGMDYAEERVIAGWGEQGGGLGASDVLLKALVYVYDKRTCQRLVDPVAVFKGWATGDMTFCAGHEFHDSCPGDSGSPLMAYMNDLPCSYAALGIVSWGPECGKGTPGIYTNVEKYIDWIVRIVWP